MFATSSAAIPLGYYGSNKKIYLKNNDCFRLSNAVKEQPEKFKFEDPNSPRLEELDAEAFANWLRTAYDRSSFKTLTQLAAAVGSNKATISRLMTGAPQTLTGKPSKPRVDLIIRLAKALNADETEGLFYGGHPVYGKPYKKPTNLAEFLEALEALGLEQFDFAANEEALSKLTPDDFEELLERIAADVHLMLRRKKK